MSTVDLNALTTDQYQTAKQVRARLGGVSNTWLFRRMRDEGFPRPVSRFGGRQRYWLLSGLVEWELSKMAGEYPPYHQPDSCRWRTGPALRQAGLRGH
jgi:predicted DNA-binding transcriptional regulator AlpA